MSARPIRTCVSCGSRAPQTALVRLQADADGHLHVLARPASGRSAYVHPSRECVEGLPQARGFKRSLRRAVDRGERVRVVELLSGRQQHRDDASSAHERIE